jgi:hypothetical protein
MRALVVYESMVGNTEAAARAVAAGLADELQVELLEVSHAPATIKEAVDLLVVGEPTPAFSMSRPSTREQAFDQGATRDEPNIGLHEWLAGSARARPSRRLLLRHLRRSRAPAPGICGQEGGEDRARRGLRRRRPEELLGGGLPGSPPGWRARASDRLGP